MRGVALAAIRGYQRWISPYKGYRCTLCAVTGGESCSNYGFRVIERFGLRRGLGLLDRRFELCGHVHRTVRAAAPRPAPPVHNPWRHRERGSCDLPCDAPGCDLLDLAQCGCDIWDCGHANRQRAGRWRDRCCGPGVHERRSSAELDALARRIADRNRQRQS